MLQTSLKRLRFFVTALAFHQFHFRVLLALLNSVA